MSRIDDIRDAVTVEFLNNRPSFARFQKRAEQAGFTVDRYDYAAVKSDIRQIETLWRTAEIDKSKVTLKKSVINSWGKEGDSYFQVKTFLDHRETPPDIRPEPVEVTYKVTPRPTGTIDTLVIPDLHFGYKRVGETLVPIHDEAYCSALLGVIAHYRPAHTIMVGDNLDAAGFGRFKNDPGYLFTTRAATTALYHWYARVRAANPDGLVDVLEGNHEARIRKSLRESLPEGEDLYVADTDISVFSPRHFLRLDELGFNYHEPYGVKLRYNDVTYLHGELIGSAGGDTTSKMLKRYRGKSVQGHTHRLGVNFRTDWETGEPRYVWAMEVGTGARLDGLTPGSHEPDWQQGFGAVWSNGTPGVYPFTGSFEIQQMLFKPEVDYGQLELSL